VTDEITSKPLRKKKPQRTKKDQYQSPDGIRRPPRTEHQINEAFAIVFRGQAADLVLSYLKSVTTNQVKAPGTSPDEITYHEGARWLMGVIDTRKLHGEEKKP